MQQIESIAPTQANNHAQPMQQLNQVQFQSVSHPQKQASQMNPNMHAQANQQPQSQQFGLMTGELAEAKTFDQDSKHEQSPILGMKGGVNASTSAISMINQPLPMGPNQNLPQWQLVQQPELRRKQVVWFNEFPNKRVYGTIDGPLVDGGQLVKMIGKHGKISNTMPRNSLNTDTKITCEHCHKKIWKTVESYLDHLKAQHNLTF